MNKNLGNSAAYYKIKAITSYEYFYFRLPHNILAINLNSVVWLLNYKTQSTKTSGKISATLKTLNFGWISKRMLVITN